MIIETLRSLNACEEALDWASQLGHDDPERAWNECSRGDWMLWYAAKCGVDRTLLVLVACEIAEGAVRAHWRGGPEQQAAIDAVRAWARGEATIEQVQVARRAAAYASDAATDDATDDAAAEAAEAAAEAASYASDAAYAAEAAACAADAAYAAYAARLGRRRRLDAADAAAYEAALAELAHIIRAESAHIIRNYIPFGMVL